MHSRECVRERDRDRECVLVTETERERERERERENARLEKGSPKVTQRYSLQRTLHSLSQTLSQVLTHTHSLSLPFEDARLRLRRLVRDANQDESKF